MRNSMSPRTRPTNPAIGLLAFLVIGLTAGRLGAEEDAPHTFENVTEQSGLQGAGMAAWSDYNNDGHADVVVDGTLFANQGDATFKGVPGFIASRGAWADFDNDGRPDYYVTSGKGALLRNLGDDRFQSVPVPPNPEGHSRGAAWADADNDGFVDLYVTNYEIWPTRSFFDLLYMNNGDGTFSEPTRFPPEKNWRARGVNWSDFDNDGDQDFYVSNYRLMPNQLWINDGSGEFTDEAQARGVHGIPAGGTEPGNNDSAPYQYCGHTIGSVFGDLNNDGHIDLVVVNFAHAGAYQDRTMVCISSGPPAYTFTNIGNKAGIHYQESYSKGALGDYDNDGDLDLYLTTIYGHNNGTLFENDGTGRFTDVGDKTGTRGGNSYQVAWVDYDNDGDLDLHANGKLLRNRGNDNGWVRIGVVGDGESNASAIGARVTVTAGDKTQLREVRAGSSGNQDDPSLHVGLGGHEGPVQIQVRFPSGKTVSKTVEARQRVIVRESE